jgi:putative copper export protein
MVAAKVSAYAPTTHCSEDTPAASSVWIPASATLTIVMSRNVRKRTRQSVARAAERRFSPMMLCPAAGRAADAA